MKCPGCHKEVGDNNIYCPACGASLFGPRSVNLKDIGGGKNTIQSNNIKSITGIDINKLTPVPKPEEEPPKKKFEIKLPKPKKVKERPVRVPKKFINKPKKEFKMPDLPWGLLTLLLMVIILLITCICLYMNNLKLKKGGSIVDLPTDAKGIYGLTSKYSFVLPTGWIYSQTTNDAIITNDKISLLVFPYQKGIININAKKIVDNYKKQGYSVVTGEETVLNSKKIIYIKFSTGNMYFVDFYYQYDSGKIIYGQITGANDNLLTNDVKDIITSLTPQSREGGITVGKAPVAYEAIFELMN